ncbi:MAG: protein translocase subunit SecF [Calditrichaeota bacterium]|nr:protein translocase subunit SecF [Candidatus Cloacimonadota bacterium]MCB1046871.1 protein translocase subunit SecF [Calditrichota bacterium]MCB9475126.1 protein translocase subunit SecF [Candidatus Delongbacteria bacterium]
MEFIRESKIDFASKRFYALGASGLLLLVGLFFMVIHHGLVYSIDFTGGTLLQYRFEQPVSDGELRTVLNEAGISAEITTLKDIQQNSTESLIKIPGEQVSADKQAAIESLLNSKFQNNAHELRKVDRIGPRVGEELKWDALLAVVVSLLLIVVYITVRFEFKFAIGALAATAHDVLIMMGIISILKTEISLSIIAALLTIVGYSLNDTIVVYDRIRENLKRMAGRPIVDIVNASINQTLSRTILTAATTLFVVVVMLIFGGETLKPMVFALFVGIIVGTYSSIYIASPILIEWYQRYQNKEMLRH